MTLFIPCREGYNEWRDAFKPSHILDSLCKKNALPSAEYRKEEVKVNNKIFKIPPEAFPEGIDPNSQKAIVSAVHSIQLMEFLKSFS